MKKVASLFLILILVASPSFALAVAPPIDDSLAGSPQYAADKALADTQAGIANLTQAGSVVGCQTTGLGGALAQNLGAALQQAVPNFIRSKLQGPLSKLAAKAGPFGGLINSLGNMAINKLSTFVQNKLGQVFSGLAGGTVGDALNAVTGGVGAGVGAGAVPVNTVTINEPVGRVDKQTKATQDAVETKEGLDCVVNPTVAKLKNALLSLFTKTVIDFANNGFNGDTAIIGNLESFAQTATQALIQDFVSNALSGICSTNQDETKVLLLQQYQYDESFQQKSQCTDESQTSTGTADSGEQFYSNIFNDQNTSIGAYMASESEVRKQRGASNFNVAMDFLAGQGIQPKKECEDGQQPVAGVCPGGLDKSKVVLTGDQAGHIIKKAITTPVDQLLNADEIGELVDSFTAGLTQFIFQGIDGLKGASKKSGSNASYLDSMVSASTGGATDSSQQAIGQDISSARDAEQTYLDTVTSALTRVTQIKTTYTTAIACYQVAVNSSNQALALERISNASSTVSAILNPQITSLTTLKQKSQAALATYDDLLARLDTASSQDEILAVYTDYQAFLSSGQVHSAVDLSTLQNGMDAADASLTLLSTDANALVAECRAL